ncbi:MAG: amino acid permease [Planctomycetota bacterium]|jgi:APA family basic amino acid/polyamine antiporter|nr:amino acid permease [Planctomycetota bacterium]MDP6520776.1 amino acid permease [Planctomycetota bacterium]MDP6837668.1 amino acid permease [Planctomycetota bacterium]
MGPDTGENLPSVEGAAHEQLCQGPRLTLIDATLMVMGGVLGVGIFFTPQAVAALLPHPGAFLGAWAIGGVVALSGGLTFAELAGSFPRRGGAFEFLREAFGPFPAFLLGWLALGAISTGAIAVIADFFANTAAGLHPSLAGHETWLGVLLICGLTALHATGIKHSALFQNGCMLFKVGAIGVLLIAGLVFFQAPTTPQAPVPFPPLANFPRAMLPVLFSLGGYQLITAIAPEVRQPTRTIPRALLLGIAGVIAIYLLLNLTWLRVLGLETLAQDPGFAAQIGQRTLGPAGETFLRVSMAISALGVCTVVTATSPSFYVAMARQGLFFRSFGRLRASSGAPLNALLCQAAIALAYFLLGGASEILERTVFPEWILNALIGLSLLSLRRRRPDLPRPFKSPAWPLFPLLYTLAALTVVIGNLLESSWSVTGTGILLTAAGALLYLPWRRYSHSINT